MTVTSKGTANYNSTGLINIIPSSNCATGGTLTLCISYNNSLIDGSDPFDSIDDSHGNTWTLRVSQIQSPNGLGGDGVVMRMYTTNQDMSPLTTGDSIDVRFLEDIVVACSFLLQITSDNSITYTDANSASFPGEYFPTISSISLTTNDIIIGCAAGNNNSNKYGDSDTTNGSWSSNYTDQVSVGISNQLISQYKIISGTGVQSYDPQFEEVSDAGDELVIGYVVFTDNVPPSISSKTFIMITSMSD